MGYRFLFLLGLVLLCFSFPPCGVVEFDDFTFDITSLYSQNIPITNANQTAYVRVNYCLPSDCPNIPTGQKSFILRQSNGICQPFTINATIASNFQYINSNAPQNGLRISYLPLVVPNVTAPTPTLLKYTSFVDIYCDSTEKKDSFCSQSTSSSLKSDNITTLVENKLICSVWLPVGCPEITINHFWDFLIANRIWFAVILWIFAGFELFMGYFVIRFTILLYGICTGAVFGIIFSAQNYTNFFFDSSNTSIPTFIVVLSFIMGLLFGLALLTVPKLGYVNIGMWDAIIFSLLLQNGALYSTGSMLGFYITLGISCLLMTAVSLLGFRKFIILSTPFISSFWLVRTLGFVLPYYPNEFSSTKLFAIHGTTPWQFYLYLISMLILSILGCTFQFCWYKRKGRDNRNKGYYLEDDDAIKDKIKRLLQFEDIRKIIKTGKDQVMFLKNLVAEEDDSEQPRRREQPKASYIEMTKMSKPKRVSPSPIKRRNIQSDEEVYTKNVKKDDQSGSEGRGKRKEENKISTSQVNKGRSKIKRVQTPENSSQQQGIEVKKVQGKSRMR